MRSERACFFTMNEKQLLLIALLLLAGLLSGIILSEKDRNESG